MQLAVEIEDQESWPPDFVSEVTRHRPLILAYQRERSRIDKLCQDDVMVRIDPPKNKHKAAYTNLVDRLEALLSPHRLVAYHCTRLTPHEIGVIKNGGLRLLTQDLVKQKLDRCHADGHIAHDAYQYLKRSESIAGNVGDVHANRSGMIWFCPNRSTLREYSGVYRLFRSWGGEAIYCGHEKDEKIADVLASVGIPCIVKCAIPFERRSSSTSTSPSVSSHSLLPGRLNTRTRLRISTSRQRKTSQSLTCWTSSSSRTLDLQSGRGTHAGPPTTALLSPLLHLERSWSHQEDCPGLLARSQG